VNCGGEKLALEILEIRGVFFFGRKSLALGIRKSDPASLNLKTHSKIVRISTPVRKIWGWFLTSHIYIYIHTHTSLDGSTFWLGGVKKVVFSVKSVKKVEKSDKK